jgi:hypothetical protein
VRIEHNPEEGPLHAWPGQKEGVVGENRAHPHRHPIVKAAELAGGPPLGSTGDPLRLAPGGRDPAIECGGRLQQHERPACAGRGHEPLVEQERFLPEQTDLDGNTPATQQGEASSVHGRVGIAESGHHPTDPG